jgi:hypothetical protein
VWTPSDAIVSGATATLTLEIYFNTPYAGAKNLLAYAADPTQNDGTYRTRLRNKLLRRLHGV